MDVPDPYYGDDGRLRPLPGHDRGGLPGPGDGPGRTLGHHGLATRSWAARRRLADGAAGLRQARSRGTAGVLRRRGRGAALAGRAPTVPVPEVLCGRCPLDRHPLVAAGPPSPAAGRDFGRGLADLHAAGTPTFGAPGPGFIGPLPLDNDRPDDRLWPPSTPSDASSRPWSRRATGAPSTRPRPPSSSGRWGGSTELAGASADEPPSRLHGDLWSGNLVFDDRGGRCWVIDPAAHGGHRETDLAMLALFGAPTSTGSSPPTTSTARWPRAGGSGWASTSSIPSWCTPPSSGPPTAPGRRRPPDATSGHDGPGKGRALGLPAGR